jgi:hypothetical protein
MAGYLMSCGSRIHTFTKGNGLGMQIIRKKG